VKGTAPRQAAADLLLVIIREKRTLDEAMSQVASFRALSGSDRGLARAIVSAALRQLGRIDKGLSVFLKRPLEQALPEVQALLRIGAAQSWVLEMPDHAVVNATVNAARQTPAARRASGFINAVLRKVVSDRSGFEAVPVASIWPAWLGRQFSQALGQADAERLATAQLIPPDLHLTPRSGEARTLSEKLQAPILAGHSVQVPTGAVEALPGFASGEWWVQDVAASLPVRLLKAEAQDHVLELCAAPGGKTMQIAATGAKVTAIDRSRKRMQRVTENLERTGLGSRVDQIVGDASDLSDMPLMSHILLDAPCSALGTLRRHPEGAWIKQADDIARYPDIQKRLLNAALSRLRKGGILIYCVCSPLPSEGRDVVAAVLDQHPGQFERKTVNRDELPGFETCLTDLGDVLTLPVSSFAHDAFYVARLTRL